MKGLSWHENALGFTSVALHYSADPAKDPNNPDPKLAEHAREWIAAQRRLFPDPNDFSREYELNFYVGKGTRVFPQFTAALHTKSLSYTRHKVIYRGWDFGWHVPVCLVAQVDPRERLLILREIIGAKQTTRDFAEQVIKICNTEYQNHAAGFQDFCDPAGQQVKSIESERSERRDIEILNGLGVFPSYEFGWSRKDGRTLIHQLLAVRHDMTPGMYVDPTQCPLVVQGFLGQYVYPERKIDNRVSEDPNDDEHPWGDVFAALRYLVTGLHSKLGLRRLLPQIAPPIVGTGGYEYHTTGYGTMRKKSSLNG